nr:hypothetical protein [Tanacetum cinerariifolium]
MVSSSETNYHCDKCALFFKKVDQYLKHVNDVHNVHQDVESVQHHDSFNYHDFVVARDPYLLKSESTTTSPITPKRLESECTPSKPKEEDLFKPEMIEVVQAIRSPKSPDWSPQSDSKSEVVVRDVFYDLMVNIKAINKEIAVEVCRNRWWHDVPPPYHNSCLRSPGGERALRKRCIYCLH